MTIYKPKLAGEKAKPATEQKLKTYDDELSDDNPFIQDDAVEILGQATTQRKHHMSALNWFVVIVTSIVIALTVLGMTYFLIVHRRHSDVNKPWIDTCRVRYHEWRTDAMGKERSFLHEGEIYQQVEIDVSRERYEKLNVPSVFNAKRAVVLHDMELGLTAVIDQDHGRCFVAQINATLVKPVSDFYSLVENNKAGYYLPNAELIHDNYAIAHPPIADILSEFGPRIMSECQFYDTYRLMRDDTLPEEKTVTPCRYQNERYCMGNAGSKFMLIFTISRCVE